MTDLASYYGVPGQWFGYVEGFATAFIHQQTGTFNMWVERTLRFSTVEGHDSASYWAPEYYVRNQIPGAVLVARLPEHVRYLAATLDLPNRFQVTSQFGYVPAM